MLLLIDNYDSFVYNLARYFARLGQEALVVRNDRITPEEVTVLAPEAIVLSPGPCTPNEAGRSLEIVRRLHREIPMLGVCLGHQTIAAAFGGQVARTPWPMHGRVSRIEHNGCGIFDGIRNPLTVCRYHSLIVQEETLPDELGTTAWTDDRTRSEERTVMAIAHRTLPIFGVQFHPESILTDAGFSLLANFLSIAGCDVSPSDAMPTGELKRRRATTTTLPDVPVTF